MSYFLMEQLLGFFFQKKKKMLFWEKIMEGEGGRQYFLKLRCLTRFLKQVFKTGFPFWTAKGVHLSNIAKK